MGVHKLTISREFGRDKGLRGWRPRQAQELRNERLSGLLWKSGLRISHELIYCTFMQTSAVVATYGDTCAVKSYAGNVTRVVKNAGARSKAGHALTSIR